MNSIYTTSDGYNTTNTILSTSTGPAPGDTSSSASTGFKSATPTSGSVVFKDELSSNTTMNGDTVANVSKSSSTLQVKRSALRKNKKKKARRTLPMIDEPEKIIGSQVMAKNKLSKKMVKMLNELG